jgi:hypothetical protein
MGRVKIPRCDNCGAPVEFAQGVLEARCEYCNEVLIRELPPPMPVVMAPLPPPPPIPVRRSRGTVWPFLLTGIATLGMAGASGFASFLAQVKPLPTPAADTRATLAAVPEVRVERDSATQRPEGQKGTLPERSAPGEGGTTRGRRLARPTTPSAQTAPPASAEPPKPPRFDTQAAVAGLDAAQAKAQASCKGADGVRLFVQMGFDPDGVNRGAALSDPKLKGTPEAKCTLRIFRAVRIPAFDPATRPSGLGRAVRL